MEEFGAGLRFGDAADELVDGGNWGLELLGGGEAGFGVFVFGGVESR